MTLSSVIAYFVTLFLTEYITENIGIEAYGFVSIAITFVSYGGIITIALTSFMVRYISLSYHKNQVMESKSYYVSSINASLLLCGFLTIVFLALILKLELIINIPDHLIYPIKLLFLSVYFSFVLQTMSTPFSIGFYIKNKLDVSGLIKIIAYLLEIIVLVVLFSSFTPTIWFVGIGLCVMNLMFLVGCIIINKRLLPEFNYETKLHSYDKILTLIKNGSWYSINQLGNTLNSGLDLLVSNAMLTGVQTGQIAVAKSIGVMFGTLSNIIFQPLQPVLLKSYSDGLTDKFLNELKKAMKLCGFIGSLSFSGFFALGLLLYKLWLPTQYSALLHFLTLLTVFTFVMDIFLQPIYYVNILTVKNKIPCFVTIAGGLLNVFGMYMLIKHTELGVYSVPITTLVIMFCINFFFNPIYACWCLKINKMYFYPLIFRHLFATGLMCIVFKVISLILNPSGWIGLITSAIVMTVLGAFIYGIVAYNKEERKSLFNKMKNKVFKCDM